MTSLCITILVRQNVVADALSWKSQGVLASVASREWQMLETVGQIRLQYNDQAQGVLGSLVATSSLLSRVIESQGRNTKISSIRDRVLSGTGDKGWAIHTDGSLWYRRRVRPEKIQISQKGQNRNFGQKSKIYSLDLG